MASLFGIPYYAANVIPSLQKWTLLKDATKQQGTIVIKPGGFAGVSLSSNYCNALKASNYRRIKLSAMFDYLDDAMNYRNLAELLVLGTYKNENGGQSVYWLSLNCTKEGSEITGGTLLGMSREVQMGSFDFETCQIIVNNHSNVDMTLTYCAMLRSQDISSSQVGESIGWGVTLAQVIQYLDGCELFYEGSSTPDKLWWVSDNAGNFAGVNVNNERTIKFSKKNEVLLD